MRLLELFSGTGSMGRAFEALGWEVTSLDLEGEPTIKCDILSWDHTKFPPGHFQVVWASPVCCEFSKALTRRPRRLEEGDRLVLRTLELIDYFKPRFWGLENPQSGLLKTRPYMEGLPFQDVTYCSYGSSYRKRTRIWGTLPFVPRPQCFKGSRCEGFRDGRHPTRAQRGSYCQQQLYAIPRELCEEIARSVNVPLRVLQSALE